MTSFFNILAILAAALLIALMIVLYLQTRIKTAKYEEFFPVEQVEPAFIVPLSQDRIILHWDPSLQPERVTLTDSPHSGTIIEEWQPTAESIEIETNVDQEHFRPFFHLSFPDRSNMVVSTRVFPFEGIRNFRDLGGYTTEDGQQVAWGRVYRSGQMGRPTQVDLDMLATLNLKTVIDLRDQWEVDHVPDQLPELVNYQRVYITKSIMVSRASVMIRRQRLGGEFSDAYKNLIVEHGAAGIGEVFQILSDPQNLPAVIHCTAGKDRAGMISALVLLTVGVPEKLVVADYTLSNLFAEQHVADIDRRIRRVRWLGMRKEHFYVLAAAQPKVMLETLAYIRAKYGSIREYLVERAGVPEQTLDRLKESMGITEAAFPDPKNRLIDRGYSVG